VTSQTASWLNLHDPQTRLLIDSVEQFLRACHDSAAGKGPLCLNCDTEFGRTRPPTDFWFIAPYFVDWSSPKGEILITGICAVSTRMAKQRGVFRGKHEISATR
jgi:hypothetical protein